MKKDVFLDLSPIVEQSLKLKKRSFRQVASVSKNHLHTVEVVGIGLWANVIKRFDRQKGKEEKRRF